VAASEVEICNEALGAIAETDFLDTLEEPSAAAIACKQFYAHSRDAVLESFWWPFATRQQTLAALDITVPSGWGYAYALPSDCLAPQYLWSGTRNPHPDLRIPFTLQSNEGLTSSILLTDQESAELVYTAKVTSPGRFSALFAEAVGYHLAAKLALALPGKRDFRSDAIALYKDALLRAASAAAASEQRDVEPDSAFITARK
jgi:hypothetical protein